MYDNRNEKNYLRISYDAKKNDVKATLNCYEITRDGNPARRTETYEGLVPVNDAIKAFVERRASSLLELIARNKIRVDKNAEKYIMINYDNSSILLKGSRRYFQKRDYSEDTVTNDEKTESKPTITEEHVTEGKHSFRDSVNKKEIIAEIIRLNPTVVFDLQPSIDGSDVTLLSSAPADGLVLPEGFEFNEKNGITNKHHTTTGAYTTITVLPLVKKMNDETKVEYSKPVSEEKTSVVTGTKTEKTTGTKITETTSKIKSKIKNLRMVNWKKLKRILIGSGIAVVVIALVSEASKHNNSNDDKSVPPTSYTNEEEIIYADPLPEEEIIYADPLPEEEIIYADPLPEDNDIYDEVREVPFESSEEPIYVDPIEPDYTYEAPYVEPIETNYSYEAPYVEPIDSNEITTESKEKQLDDILQIGYRNIGDIYQFLNGGSLIGNIESCDLEKYASDNDRDAIRTILNARDYVIRNAYTDQSVPLTLSDVYRFLDNYVNYAFEGSTMFDGQTIKAYDYLDPNSQYIATVIGEAMLQLYPGYEYESSTSRYSYGELVERFANEHGETAESFTNGRSY